MTSIEGVTLAVLDRSAVDLDGGVDTADSEVQGGRVAGPSMASFSWWAKSSQAWTRFAKPGGSVTARGTPRVCVKAPRRV